MNIEKANKYLDRSLTLLVLAVVFAVPVVFGAQETLWNSFTLPKAVVFRFLVSVLAILASFKMFLSPKLNIRGSGRLFLFLGLWTAAWAVSSTLSAYPDLSLWGRYDRMQGLYTFVHFIVFFLVLTFFINTRTGVKRVLTAMAASSAVVSVYGVIQYAGLDPYFWKENVSFPHGRIISTLGQPNFLAHFLVLVIPVTVFLFLNASRRLVRALLGTLFLVQIAALVFTFSRGGWLALVVGVFLAVIGVCLILGKKRILYGVAATGVAVLVLVFGAVVLSSAPPAGETGPSGGSFSKKVTDLADIGGGSARMRLYYWQASWEEFKTAPVFQKLFGHGPDTLSEVFVKHYQRDWGVQESINTYPNRAHNLFFDNLLSLGLLGVLAGALFFGYILWRAGLYLRNNRENRDEKYWLVFTLVVAIIMHGVNNLVGFSGVTSQMYFYALLALLAALVFKKEVRIQLSSNKIPRAAAVIALTIFGGIMIFFYNIDLIRADLAYMDSRKILVEEEGDPVRKCSFAIDGINSAITLNNIHNFYKQEYMRVSLNCFDELSFFKEKVKRNLLSEIESVPPQQRSYSFGLYVGRVYSRLARSDPSYYAEAESTYKELIETSPYITTPYKELARLKLRQDKEEEATAILLKAVAKSPFPDASYASEEQKIKAYKELISLYDLLARATGDEERALKFEETKEDLRSSISK